MAVTRVTQLPVKPVLVALENERRTNDGVVCGEGPSESMREKPGLDGWTDGEDELDELDGYRRVPAGYVLVDFRVLD